MSTGPTLNRWIAVGPGRWRFTAVPVDTPSPNSVTASRIVDAFNDGPWAPGDPAVDAYDLEIVDHEPVDTDRWEITGTVTIIRRSDLDHHVDQVHTGTGSTPFPCEDCYFPH